MISLQLGTEYLDLSDDTAISLTWKNPLFSVFNEGYSYSFAVKNTAKNRALIASDLTNVILRYKSLIVEEGTLESSKITDKGIEIAMISKASSLRKQMQAMKMNELDLEEIQICLESDDPATKLAKWKAHMTATALNPNSGTHKFPMIRCIGYNELDPNRYSVNDNFPFNSMGSTINLFSNGEYVSNFPMFTNLILHKFAFATTVAPCPRMEYLLTRILSHFGLTIGINELAGNIEFSQMIVFNNYVKDRLEYIPIPLYNYNTHGDSIDLSQHVPDTDVFSFFQTLNEIFDAYFVLQGKVINIYLSRTKTEQKAVNISTALLDEFEDEKSAISSATYKYESPEESDLKLPIFSQYDYQESTPEVLPENGVCPYDPISLNSDIENKQEISIQHLPLMSKYEMQNQGVSLTYPQYEDYWLNATPANERNGYGEWISYLYSHSILKTDGCNEPKTAIATAFWVGCFRGIQPTYKYNHDAPLVPTTPDHIFSSNFKVVEATNNEIVADVPVSYSFGNASNYLSGPDNCFDAYKLKMAVFGVESEIKKRSLKVPIHSLLESKSWAHVRHLIQSKRESFKGLVQELNFTLSNKGVSPTVVTYLVKKSRKADFNNDYNNDYNS